MAILGVEQRGGASVGRPFYLIMSLLMAAVIIGGFSHTVPGDFAPPGIPVLLHVHGAIFTLWVVLMVAQPALIAQGSVRLHRRIGIFGAALAGAMVVMGVTATVIAIRDNIVPSFFPIRVFLVMNILSILTFGALVAAAVALRGKPEWHKRLMLSATASILGPGLGRLLPMHSFGPAAPLVMFAVIGAFALAGPVADLAARRRVHPAYLWGAGTVLVTQLAIGPLAFAPPTAALLRVVQSY